MMRNKVIAGEKSKKILKTVCRIDGNHCVKATDKNETMT